MRRFVLLSALLAAVCLAQQATPQQPPPPSASTDDEQENLRRTVSESSSSANDLLHALIGHLARYPNSPHLAEIERAIAKAAIETRDEANVALYGERVLAREPDDLILLDRVTRALLTLGDPESLKRALAHARQYEQLIRGLNAKSGLSGADLAKRREEVDRAIGRALLSQAIATGNLGDSAASAQLARKSFDASPTAEAAAELARRLAQQNKYDEAVRAYADAFSLSDTTATAAERAAIRKRMGEAYRKNHPTEAGLGDLILEAYDRNTALLATRREALRQVDPNLGVTNPLDFTLTGIAGDSLPMKKLAGKAVVMDFWATWCGPCRAQHPLYEEVKKRFAKRDDVVFLAINTDEDRDTVKPFLKEQGWTTNKVYYEDGLSRLLKVDSIPTTVVFGRAGTVVSRMNGFDPERFVDMLSDRIEAALK